MQHIFSLPVHQQFVKGKPFYKKTTKSTNENHVHTWWNSFRSSKRPAFFLWYRRSLNKQIWFQQAPNSHSYANNKYITKPLISIPLAEMYSENCQISKMECFANIVNSLLQGDPSSMFQRILNTQNCTKAVQKQYKSCTKTA